MPAAPLSDAQARSLVNLVQFKVGRFLGPSPRNRSDAPELVQEVLVRVLERLNRFDPSRGCLATFVARVTETVLIDQARKAGAAKRNPCRSSDMESGPHLPRAWSTQPVHADLAAPEMQRDQQDLAIDLKEAVERLPPELRRLAEQLQHNTVPEIAEREQVHKGTVYRRLHAIRRHWDDGTLRDYLEP